MDVAPTALTRLGIAVPESMTGIGLLGPRRSDRDVYAETEYPSAAGWSPLAALTDGRAKLIDGPDPDLYDLANDREEMLSLAGARESTVRAMASRLAQLRAGGTSTTTTPGQGVSWEVSDRLRALGYVAAAPPQPDGTQAPNPAAVIASWVRFEEALGGGKTRLLRRGTSSCDCRRGPRNGRRWNACCARSRGGDAPGKGGALDLPVAWSFEP